MSAARLDRGRPPAPGRPRTFAFPRFERGTLENGIELLVAPMPHTPLFEVSLLAPAGAHYAPRDAPGLAGMHAGLLDEGTPARSALDIARTMEQLGGNLGTGADWDVLAVNVGALSEHLEAAMSLAAEVLRTPSFPPAEVERLRQRRLAEILRGRDDPSTAASDELVRTLYRGTVYGEPLIGTKEAVEAITRDRVEAFHRTHVAPSSLTVVAAGDLDLADLTVLAERLLGDWGRRATPPPPAIEPPARAGVTVTVIDRPDAPQTRIEMGHPGVPRNTPGHRARVVMNAILGGSFTSRLNLNLRQERGLTYSISSRFIPRRGPGPWVIRAAIATESVGTAVAEIGNEIDRLRQEPVPEAELDAVRRYLVGAFPYSVQTIDEVVQRLETLPIHGLPNDYYDRYPASLAEVDPEQVLTAARDHLHPETMAVIAVGPAQEVVPQLKRFGPVTVIEESP